MCRRQRQGRCCFAKVGRRIVSGRRRLPISLALRGRPAGRGAGVRFAVRPAFATRAPNTAPSRSSGRRGTASTARQVTPTRTPTGAAGRPSEAAARAFSRSCSTSYSKTASASPAASVKRLGRTATLTLGASCQANGLLLSYARGRRRVAPGQKDWGLGGLAKGRRLVRLPFGRASTNPSGRRAIAVATKVICRTI